MTNIYVPTYRVELVRETSIAERPKVTSTSEGIECVSRWFSARRDAREVFAVTCLDTKHKVIGICEVSSGTLDASLVHPREVFQPAMLSNCSAIILCHNHPSGDPTPSREDLKVTEMLSDCGHKLGIPVLDHVIHGDGSGVCQSLAEYAPNLFSAA